MSINRSLQSKITLTLTLLMIVAVSLAAALAYSVYVVMEKQTIRTLIQTEVQRLDERVSRFGDQWTTSFERDMSPSMLVWGESPRFPSDSLPPVLRELPPGLHEVEQPQSTWYVVVRNTMDGRLYLVYDTIVFEHQSQRFFNALLLIVLFFSILSFLVARLMSSWITRPLNLLMERLVRWVPGLPQMPLPHADDATQLLTIFNQVQKQVDTSIADHKAFAANLHHEIRTPLAVIQSDAELLLRAGAASADSLEERLQRIVRSVTDISRSLEGTFDLSQASFRDIAPVVLFACVDDVLTSLRPEADAAGLVLVNDVSKNQVAELSYHALLTVIRNLVRNAVMHAVPATLVISSLPNGLAFTDTGPGIPAAELDYVFERYFSKRRADLRKAAETSPDQVGLGLAIAKRVCEVQGWSLRVYSPVAEGRGTSFVLSFVPEQG